LDGAPSRGFSAPCAPKPLAGSGACFGEQDCYLADKDASRCLAKAGPLLN
jgi:hypothetical protein